MTNLPSFEYFVGRPIISFGDQLPRGIDILRYYYHFQNSNETEKIANITKQIQQLYDRAGISTIHIESIRSKVKRLIASVKSIIATRKSNRSSQIEKERDAFQTIIQLFEVVNNEAWLPTTLKDFISDQRTMRQVFVRDIQFHRANQSSIPSTTNQIQQFGNPCNSDEFSDYEMLDDDNSPEHFDFDTSPDFVPTDSKGEQKKIQLCEKDIETLSKCGGSYRVIEKALAIGIKATGGDPKDFAISKTSLCDQFNKFRSVTKSGNSEEIASNDEKTIILFDGKKFSRINARHVGKDSRMVAVCHTQNKDFVLGLPILASGNARAYANELIGLCENHNLTDRVIGLLFDTTILNTGQFGGVCAIFERETGKEVLNIACRHHIYELLLSSAMTTTLGLSVAPTLTVFDSLREEWPNIKSRGFPYEPCDEDVLNSPHLYDLYDEAKETLLNHAKTKHIRDDYAELTDLCLKFFGVGTKKNFMVPGSISRARWMARAIYGIKMYLFRHELDMEPSFEANLFEFVLFVSLIYCKYWNRCTNAFDAPVNDLQLIADLQAYSAQNENISNAVLNTIWNHLWYLGEELVVLSLFSDKVSNETKNRMRVKLTSIQYPPRSENSLKLKDYTDGIVLHDLVSDRSRFLISKMEIDSSFLTKNAATWESNPSFRKAKKLLDSLIVVVNDLAERTLGKASTIIQNQKARSEARLQNMLLS